MGERACLLVMVTPRASKHDERETRASGNARTVAAGGRRLHFRPHPDSPSRKKVTAEGSSLSTLIMHSRITRTCALRRAAGAHAWMHRRLLSSRTHSLEAAFTLSPYEDAPQGGHDRGSDFCLLTLQHEAFAQSDTLGIREVYSRKAVAGADRLTDEIFDAHQTALDEEHLSDAIAGIGLPPQNGQIRGMIAQLAASGDRDYQRAEFASLLREVWDGFIFLDVRRDLRSAFPGAPLPDGPRSLAWIGRRSSMSFVLHAASHGWPAHVESAALMRNTRPNAALDPAGMEELPIPPASPQLATALDLAAAAAAQAPFDEGGLCVRLRVACTNGSTRTHLVPLHGLPANEEARALLVHRPRRRGELLWKYGMPALALLAGAGLFAWLEAARKQNEEERRAEKAAGREDSTAL